MILQLLPDSLSNHLPVGFFVFHNVYAKVSIGLSTCRVQIQDRLEWDIELKLKRHALSAHGEVNVVYIIKKAISQCIVQIVEAAIAASVISLYLESVFILDPSIPGYCIVD
jgi:hypothetical protein